MISKTLPLFKASPHAIGKIMGPMGLTEKQAETLATMEAKPKLTEKQAETLDTLRKKQLNPELPAGAKTYCETWMKKKIYGRHQEISSKYTEKGNMVELQSFEAIGKLIGIDDLGKNEEFLENDFIHGTPDIILPDMVIDAKSSWDCFSFPLLDDELPEQDYYWQMQGYMALTDTKIAKVIYVLADTPEVLIKQEAKSYCWKNGIELIPEVMEEFRVKMTYADVPEEFKIMSWDVARNDSDIIAINSRVEMCRAHIRSLLLRKYGERIVMAESGRDLRREIFTKLKK